MKRSLLLRGKPIALHPRRLPRFVPRLLRVAAASRWLIRHHALVSSARGAREWPASRYGHVTPHWLSIHAVEMGGTEPRLFAIATELSWLLGRHRDCVRVPWALQEL
jgi:hypothetical protein